MATFNTAFGSLPKPQDQIFGNRRQPRQQGAPQQPQQQQQQQQQQQPPQQTQTFSQMQQAGQARPAPQNQAPAQPPMIAALGQQLAQQPAAAPSTAPAQAPAQKTYTPQQISDARSQQRAMRESGMQQIRSFAATLPESLRGGVMGWSGGGAGGAAGQEGQVGFSEDQFGIPSLTYTSRQGAEQRIGGQTLPQELADILGYADQQDFEAAQRQQAEAQAQVPQVTPEEAQATSRAEDSRGLTMSAPSARGSSSDTLQRRLEQQLAGYTSGPSAYDDPAYKAYRESQLANLEAEFGGKRSQLEEELAARGLASSSIASGRLGDLAGQQARARASLEGELMKEAAARQESRSQFGLQQMGSLAELASKREISQADIDMRAKQLQQEAQLKGRELDLQSARDMASAEAEKGRLSLGYAEVGSRERMSASELASREKLSAAEIGSREKLSAAEIGSREKMSAAELASREGIAGRELTQREREFGITSQLDRDRFNADVDFKTKQLMAEDKRLTYEQARDIANRKVETDRLEEQKRANLASETAEGLRMSEIERANKAQEENIKLDRDLRERLGTSQQKLDEMRFNLSEREFLVNLSNILSSGKLTPAQQQSLIDRYAPKQSGGSSASGGGYGGGGGGGGGSSSQYGI